MLPSLCFWPAELLTPGGCAILVASVAAWAAQQSPSTPDVPPPQTVPLQISSEPNGASVLVDGQPLGTTPVSLAVDPGRHAIVVRAPHAIDESRTVDLDADGWGRPSSTFAGVNTTLRLSATFSKKI